MISAIGSEHYFRNYNNVSFFVSAFSGFICSEKSTSKTSTLFWGASSVYSSSSLRPSKFWNFCKKKIIRFEIEENLSCVKLFSTGWSNSVLYKNFWVSLYSQSIWIVSANFFKCRALWLEHNSPVSYEYRSPSEKALALTWAQVRQDEYTNDILEDLKLRVRQGLVKYTHRLWGYCWDCLDESVPVVWPKTPLTDFGTNHTLELWFASNFQSTFMHCSKILNFSYGINPQ